MTHPTDNVFHPGQKSVRGLHTQESGEDGLSSNMEHKISDVNYAESALSVPVKVVSCVRPIPKEELDIFDATPGKVLPHPLGCRPVSAEERVNKPSTLVVVQKQNFPPQAMSENNPEEETVMVLPGTAAISEGQPYVEVVAEGSCNKMDTGEIPLAKPKGQPLGWRNSSRRKRTAGKYQKLYLLCMMAVMLLAVSEGLPGAQPAADLFADQNLNCFTCMDKARCPKLMKIFNKDDFLLYDKDLNDTFPECSAMPPPGSMSCGVCLDRSEITIFCFEDVRGKLDMEASDGKELRNISSVCTYHMNVFNMNLCCFFSRHLGSKLQITLVEKRKFSNTGV
ncbi:uncharacterized protein LOC141778232 [Sebastes fasciatus]|uniref:uncharacterized protein LOC141778232 n=1 Tax=Sebastes fasciatus TaxID=394691 RepID=UPI003D9F37E0